MSASVSGGCWSKGTLRQAEKWGHPHQHCVCASVGEALRAWLLPAQPRKAEVSHAVALPSHSGASPISSGDSVTSVPLATTTTQTAGAATATWLAPKPACATQSRGSVTARSVLRCLHTARLSCSGCGGLCVSDVPGGSRAGEGECLSCSQPASCAVGFRKTPSRHRSWP